MNARKGNSRMDTTIRNFIFDLGGVLIDVDKERSVNAFRRLGFSQAADWLDNYKQAGLFADLERGEISAEVFCSKIRHSVTEPLTNRQIMEAWNEMLGEIPSWKLDTLLALRNRYMVYLLSNTNPIHWDEACRKQFRYRGFEANDFFEEIYLSYEMHLVKPSKEIFQAVINCAGIIPSETMLIDDSAENCRVAESLGMKSYCPKPGEDWRAIL